MSKACTIGMLVNHQEIEHLLTGMSDTLRNAAYKIAKANDHKDMFDEDGTLIGYDEDTNKALLRECLDHYVQFANAYGSTERTDFNYYLSDSFTFVAEYCNQHQHIISFLTASFAQACGILSSVLQPAMDDLLSRGQMIDKVESYTTSFENTFYLVYGEDIDNPETYDPKEDDLSDVDVSQSPEELTRLSILQTSKSYLESIAEPINLNTTPRSDQSGRIDLIWNAPGTELP